MARRSSTFYRLEREIGDGYKSVIEFHTVVNGNLYLLRREERPMVLMDGVVSLDILIRKMAMKNICG